jgi:cobalamin biosynthesis protein CobT
VDADGDNVIPPVVEEAPEPDVSNEDEHVQDATGNGPNDSRDDSSSSEDSSSEEEDVNGDDEEEDEDVDIEGMEEDNSVVANNRNNNDNQDDGNNNGNENEGEKGDEHRYRRAEYHEQTYIGQDGLFCELLEELLQDIEHSMRPLYITRHYVEPGMRAYYTTEVHVRVSTGQIGRWRTRTIHPSTALFTSVAGAINDVARRALWSVSNTFCDRIQGTDFCFVLSRVSGTEDTMVLSYGPPWAHYLGGYQDRLLGGVLGLPDLCCTVPDGVKHKDCRGEVLG